MSFFDGPGFRPHPEDPEALRARKRRDYQANVGLGQDFAVVRRTIRGWVAKAVRAPLRLLRRGGDVAPGAGSSTDRELRR